MRTKNDFSKDKNGRTILASAEDMREWVELGFKAQRKNRTSDMPFPQDVIDLMGCVLYISREQGDGYLFHRKTKSVIINS